MGAIVVAAAVLVACQPDGRDLSLTVDDLPSELTVGRPTTMTIAVADVGSAPAPDAALGLVIPLGIDAKVVAPEGLTCNTPVVVAPSAVTARGCALGTLAPDERVEVEVRLTGTAVGVAGDVQLTATSSGGGDPRGGGAPNSVKFPVAVVADPVVDLHVTAEPWQPRPQLNTPAPSTTWVANRGTSAAGPVTVTQTVPATASIGDVTLSRADGGAVGTCEVTGRVATCSTGPHEVVPLATPDDRWTMVVQVTLTASTVNEIVHTATSPDPEPDPDPSPNTATTSTWPGLADLVISAPADVAVGSTFEATIAWVGGGFGQYVQGWVPPTLRLDSLGTAPFNAPCAGTGEVSCAFIGPFIGEGGAITATFTALAVGGPESLSFALSSEVGYASGSTRVEVVDPAITSDVHPVLGPLPFALVGEPATLPVEVRTAGPAAHDDVALTVTTPPGTVVRGAQWGDLDLPCTVSVRSATCEVGRVPGHSQVPVEVDLTAYVPGPTTVAAEVTSSTAQDDPDPWPDRVELTFPARAPFVDLGLTATQTSTTPTVNTGHDTTWVVRNHGSEPVTDATLTIDVPEAYGTNRSALLQPSAPGDCGRDGPLRIVCTFPTLAAGAEGRVEVEGFPTAPGAAAFRGSVSGEPGDPVPDEQPNEVTLAFDALAPNADLQLVASEQAVVPVVGTQTTVGARVTNAGPTRVDDARMRFEVPEGWSLDSAGRVGECTIEGRTATCGPKTISTATSWSVSVRITPSSVLSGDVVTVEVWSETVVENDPADNTGTITISSQPDLVDLDIPALTSSWLTYPRDGAFFNRTLQVVNRGSTTTTDVVLTGTFSRGTVTRAVEEVFGSGGFTCTLSGPSFTCTRPTLPPGTATLALDVRFPADTGPVVLDLEVTSSRVEDPDVYPNVRTHEMFAYDQPRGLEGTVVGPDGAPVAGATVRVYASTDTVAPTRRVDTAADGTWSALGLAPGSYKVQIAPPAGSGLAIEWWRDQSTRPAAETLVVAGTTPLWTLDIVLG